MGAMVSTGQLLTFGLTALALIVVPGPSVLFVISRAVSLGRRAALGTVVGNAAGEYVQVVFVAAGIGAVVERSVAVFTVIKLVGALYLIVLGVRSFRNRGALARVLDAAMEPRSTRRIVREGFVVGVSNPKVMIFFAAVLPQFVDRKAGHAPLQMLILGLVFLAIALVSDSIWGLVAGTARAWLADRPERLERVGGAGGLVIIGLGLRLALTGRRS